MRNLIASFLWVGLVAAGPAMAAETKLSAFPGTRPHNIILIVADDHRWDAFSYMGHPFIQTPNLDSLARGGATCKNAFASTAATDQSRAVIQTGLNLRNNGNGDRKKAAITNFVYFPKYLKLAGYETALVGKSEKFSREGFDHVVSVGRAYLAVSNTVTVAGKRIPRRGYVSDETTDHALDWLKGRARGSNFFLQISHVAPHIPAVPAGRHKGAFAAQPWTGPDTMSEAATNYAGKPSWLKKARSKELADPTKPFKDTYLQYCEAILALDDSVGRITEWLREKNLLDDTLIIYTSDHGFLLGEHGLVSHKYAYEPSIRVPLIMHCPKLIQGGTVISNLVVGYDIAPTIYDAAGLRAPRGLDGVSVLGLVRNPAMPWRAEFVYEWLTGKPTDAIPDIQALRTQRFKLIHYITRQGAEIDELYDVVNDPHERNNLVNDERLKDVAADMRARIPPASGQVSINDTSEP